jgi:hypothetical protein
MTLSNEEESSVDNQSQVSIKGMTLWRDFKWYLKRRPFYNTKRGRISCLVLLTRVGKFWLSISVILATLPRPLGREILAILCCAHIRSLPLLCPLILHMFKFMIM